MDELLTMSVVEMARRVRRGELSPVTLLDTHLKRIEETNPKINAIIAPCYDDARREAKAMEDRLAKGRDDLPPLFGVPCTIKDTFAVKGLSWDCGVWARRRLVADFDATVVERIKTAGAVIMGKTNIPEAAMWCETYNHVHGRTNNPYDLGRGVGGSSGGEGAIVAAAASPFGIGADVGGSIRFPSAFCGIAGHKPTGRMVPGTGHWPPADGPLAPYNTFGPMARRVEDLAYILPLIAGPDGHDPVCEKHEWKSPDQVDPTRLKAYYFDDNGFWAAGKDVAKAVAMAAGALGAMKIEARPWRPEGIDQGLNIWQAAMAQNPHPFIHFLEGDEKIALGREFLKILVRTSKLTFPAWGAAFLEKLSQLTAARNRRSLALAALLQRRIEERLGDHGVLICPVFPKPAPKHTWIWLDFLGISYTGVFNVLELPATILPIYHREDGLPVSVQIVGPRWHDHVTIAVAKRLEEALGGWKPKERI